MPTQSFDNIVAPNRNKPRTISFALDSAFVLAASLSVMHILNFLNYSELAGFLGTPTIRAIFVSGIFAVFFFGSFSSLANFHLGKNYDLYSVVFLAVIGYINSPQPDKTLLYSVWLFLSLFIALELARRTRNIADMASALLVVIAPAVVVSGLAFLLVGAKVIATGRVFGALGTHHVDAALALSMILLVLAGKSVGLIAVNPKRISSVVIVLSLAYSVYTGIFGLTRSVWLSAVFGVILYLASGGKNFGAAAKSVVVVLLAVVAGAFLLGVPLKLPDSVSKRIDVTVERYHSGEIDSRIVRAERGVELILEKPLLGHGYMSGLKAHNSYLNIAIDLGLVGLSIMLVAAFRSFVLISRRGSNYLFFFAIGAGGLFMHAAFESQNTPGQANFIPLLAWIAMSRSYAVLCPARQSWAVGPHGAENT